MLHIITAITGASGSIYARRFVQVLNRLGHRQTIIITDPGRQVISYELELSLPDNRSELKDYLCSNWNLSKPDLVQLEDINNINAAVASGSRAPEAMVVIPCTMGTIARTAQGLASNLLERAFDVMLKEKKKLIIVPRETPLNQIHLQNMLNLSQLGVDIIPAMPAFYHKPTKIMELIDFMVGRVLEHLQIDHSLYQRWQKRKG